MKVTCTICGGSHPKWDCTKPQKESTAARKDVQSTYASDVLAGRSGNQLRDGNEGHVGSNPTPWQEAGIQALPVDMPSSGSSSRSEDIEEPALRKGHEVSRGAERKEQHPTHKPKIGRPKTDFDRNEYQKLYMRDKATIKRLGLTCTVKEYRESLK